MKTIPVDRAELVRLMKLSFSFASRAVTYIKYLLGGKLRMGSDPPSANAVDCSGYVRWLIYGATHGQTLMPDGSWYQQEWCKSQGFKRTDYGHCILHDSRLRIAFINPRAGKVGHVWVIINGQTIESYGGHGAGRRAWDTPALINNVSACYVLTDVLT